MSICKVYAVLTCLPPPWTLQEKPKTSGQVIQVVKATARGCYSHLFYAVTKALWFKNKQKTPLKISKNQKILNKASSKTTPQKSEVVLAWRWTEQLEPAPCAGTILGPADFG